MTTGATDAEHTAAWYARAADELAGTSALQVGWARGIAADPEVAELIATLPRAHRQPSLLFSVARLLGAPAASWAEWRAWLLAEWPRVAAEAVGRRTQTNEPGRCAPLLVALDRIPGPIGLIELGASAGLCLAADRYAYRFGDGPVIGEPGAGPLLQCAVTGAGEPPSRIPDIAWRVGVDLQPLDVRESGDIAWLEALLPPDRPDRLERLRAAIARIADDPPRVVAGDALDELPGLVAAVPDGVTPIVAALGTLVYLAPGRRARLVERIARLGARSVALEPAAALPDAQAALAGLTAPRAEASLLSLDGVPIAYSSPHGERIAFLAPR